MSVLFSYCYWLTSCLGQNSRLSKTLVTASYPFSFMTVEDTMFMKKNQLETAKKCTYKIPFFSHF